MTGAGERGARFDGACLRRQGFTLDTGQVHLPAGCVSVVLGANGSGKTSVLRLAAGLERPHAGRVLVHGRDVAELSARARAECIAYVPQRSVVGAPLTVRQVVALGRYALGASPGRVVAALEVVRMAHRADEPFHRLSVGQQQRVVLARALAQHAEGGVLVLDETLAPVDPPETHRLVQVVRQLAAAGSTIVLATHDLALAAATADWVWYLAHGATARFGPAAEVLEPHALAALAGVPIASAQGNRGMLPVPDLTAMLRHDP